MSLGAAVDTSLKEIDRYNASMRKSMIDKIYFLDKVEADVFIDFGCADGSMLKMCQALFPDNTYYGYDCDPEMIKAAEKNCEGLPINFVHPESNLRKLVADYKARGKKICLVFSSVLHEVYHYGPKSVDDFWSLVWGLEVDYIAIRDMSVSRATSRPSDPISVSRIRQCYNGERIAQWESRWGNLSENWSLVHFLLHYRYVDHWEREYRENYLPINKEELLSLIPNNYFPEFVEHYTLPFIRRECTKDFGIQLQDPTHLKLILRREQ